MGVNEEELVIEDAQPRVQKIILRYRIINKKGSFNIGIDKYP